MTKPYIAFAKRLKSIAADKGLSQPCDVAKVTGLNRVSIGAYMRGDRGASLETCTRIAEVLGGDPRWLHSGNTDVMLRGGQRLEKHLAFKEPVFKPNDKAIQKEKENEGTLNFSLKREDLFQLTIALEAQAQRDKEYIKHAVNQEDPFDADDLEDLLGDYQSTLRLLRTAIEIEQGMY